MDALCKSPSLDTVKISLISNIYNSIRPEYTIGIFLRKDSINDPMREFISDKIADLLKEFSVNKTPLIESFFFR
jgi:hypothetical protein